MQLPNIRVLIPALLCIYDICSYAPTSSRQPEPLGPAPWRLCPAQPPEHLLNAHSTDWTWDTRLREAQLPPVWTPSRWSFAGLGRKPPEQGAPHGAPSKAGQRGESTEVPLSPPATRAAPAGGIRSDAAEEERPTAARGKRDGSRPQRFPAPRTRTPRQAGGRKGAGRRAARREALPAAALLPPPAPLVAAPPLTRHADSSGRRSGPAAADCLRARTSHERARPCLSARSPLYSGGISRPRAARPPPAPAAPGPARDGGSARARRRSAAIRGLRRRFRTAALSFPFLSFFPSGLVRSISDCKLWLSGRPNLVTSPSAADSCAAALLDRARQRHLGSSVPRSGSPLHKENVVRCAAYAGAEGNIPSIQPPSVWLKHQHPVLLMCKSSGLQKRATQRYSLGPFQKLRN